MRYTESRLAKIAQYLLDDLDKDTVDFQDNYDGSEREPTVLPAKFPNLLVNGAGGIAVGMATNIPPHNLGEVIDGTMALLDNPELTIDDLTQIIPRARFSDRRHDPRPRRRARRLPQGPRLHHHARQGARGRDPQGSRSDHHHRHPLSGEQEGPDREDRRQGQREGASKASPTSGTRATARACASSSS